MTGDGPAQRFARWAGPDGVIVGLAIDHRDALVAAWEARNGAPPTREWLEALKSRIVGALSGEATALLLDAEYGGQAIREGLVPAGVALIMPLEEQGYESVGDGRVTRLMADFGANESARLGAAGCKLLLPYQPDDVRSAALQDAVAARAIAQCHEAGLPLVVEPIVYRIEGELDASFHARLAERIWLSAARLGELRPDLLKLQFPAGTPDDLAACRDVTRACGAVPWVLLGAGSDADTFARQVDVACRAGATGFMVGRTVWGSALVADPREQARAIDQTARPMLRSFAHIARSSCAGAAGAGDSAKPV